jgi:hypothetical protein
MQQHATAFDRKAPGRQNRFAFGARPQPLGDAIDKQIRDLVFAQVPLGKRLIILPQPLAKLRHRGPR